MVTAKERPRCARLADGDINIVIGTHALLAKGIEFSDLGLLIVDEEQHFGVAHKEKLKALKADVHVLTLTATPIPRTLQLALTGVREMSLIATPPVDRWRCAPSSCRSTAGDPRGDPARALPRRPGVLRRARASRIWSRMAERLREIVPERAPSRRMAASRPPSSNA
jgi:transcription-repair coupling factor (superfamily II helicase)